MHYTVHIKPSGYNLIVNPGETIIAAAVRQGYQLQRSCQEINCEQCKGHLLEGKVAYDNPQVPSLSEAEREAGLALLCAAQPLSDLTIQFEGLLAKGQLPVKKLSYQLVSLKQLANNIYQVILQPPLPDYINYRAGQYIEILQRDAGPRPFSIANCLQLETKNIELHIRHLSSNPYTQQLLAEITSTQRLLLQGPFGNCELKYEPPYPLILLAGGTGIAPLKAIIEQALSENFPRTVHLYWGVRNVRDLYLSETINYWLQIFPQFRYTPVLSAKAYAGEWVGRVGLVHEAVVADYASLATYHVYASGPTEMVFAAWHAFKAKGLSRALMYSDAFDYPAS